MMEILSTLHDMEGANKDNLSQMARSMFIKMEVGEDGELTIAQFTSACLMNEDVVHLLRGKEVEGDNQPKQE